MQSTAKRAVVPKACDACRRRKTKCNGGRPCSGCLSASLVCTFDMPRGLGGNRGARATVLNELRGQQEHLIHTQSTDPLQQSTTPRTAFNDGQWQLNFDAYIKIFMERVHPVVPLLSEPMLQALSREILTSQGSHQMMMAFCAYVKNFIILREDEIDSSALAIQKDSVSTILKTAMHGGHRDGRVQANAISVHSSFFLYGAWAGQGDYHQAWYYLRESTTLYMMMNPHFDTFYTAKEHRCLFWILLVSERSHAVRRNRPITLSVTANTPFLECDDGPGLQYLASLFQPLGESFFAIWNNSSQDCSKDWLLRKENDVRSALPDSLAVSNEEIANLRVSQSWLRIKLWELFPRFGFLSTESVYECLTFRYPLIVARDLIIITQQLPVASLQIHGVGMTEKIFDIACAVADVLPFVPLVPSQHEEDPVSYLSHIALLLQQLPTGLSKFIPLLLVKVNEVNSEVAKLLCKRMDIPALLVDNPMSPDTRFTYEEEVGRALYIDLRKGL